MPFCKNLKSLSPSLDPFLYSLISLDQFLLQEVEKKALTRSPSNIVSQFFVEQGQPLVLATLSEWNRMHVDLMPHRYKNLKRVTNYTMHLPSLAQCAATIPYFAHSCPLPSTHTHTHKTITITIHAHSHSSLKYGVWGWG